MNENESIPAVQTPTGRRRVRIRYWLAGCLAVLLIATLAYATRSHRSGGLPATAARQPAACKLLSDDQPMAQPGPVAQTSATTIEDAYWCLFANYSTGSALDDRQLLSAAFTAFTQELQRRGLDRPMAALPPLTGNPKTDWAAFDATYREVMANLPEDTTVREALALAAITGMVDSLHDDHTEVTSMLAGSGAPAGRFDLGMHTLPTGGPHPRGGPEQNPPLYIDAVVPKTPAATAGLRPGDIIEAVNGMPPYLNGVLEPGVVALLYPSQSQPDPVRVTIRRPATGETRTVTLTPVVYDGSVEPKVDASLVPGAIAKIAVPGFFPGVADQIRQAVADVSKQAKLRGIILDMRDNRGGDPDEVGKLFSSFAHDKIYLRLCDVHWTCTASRSDTSTPLLNLPLVVLTSRSCGSACDNFAAAVKDYKVGQLVGTRTAGIASGPGIDYLLSDNKTVLGMPKFRALGPRGETMAGIGIPADHYAPVTPEDLSAVRDPGLDKALELLAH